MKIFKLFGSKKMNKAECFIQEMEDEMSKSNIQLEIEKGLKECWNKLEEKCDSEEMYSAGIYCGNMGFGYLTFTANTIEGNIEKVKSYQIDDYYKGKSEEELRLSIKWNAPDWKYHDSIFSDHFEEASKTLTELTEQMYSFEENEEEYDLYEDVYNPGHELIYKTIIAAVASFKSSLSIKDEVIVGMFCGDASHDFMLKNCIPVNKPNAIRSIIKDLQDLGEIHNLKYLDEDYSDFE